MGQGARSVFATRLNLCYQCGMRWDVAAVCFLSIGCLLMWWSSKPGEYVLEVAIWPLLGALVCSVIFTVQTFRKARR